MAVGRWVTLLFVLPHTLGIKAIDLVSLDLSTSDLLKRKLLALELTVPEELVLVTNVPCAEESPPLSPC